MPRDLRTQIQLINSALNGAVSSINLVKQLLRELEGGKGFKGAGGGTREMPGIVGKFVGKEIETEDGKTYEVPSNYASKSRIVYGDTLKMIEQDGRKVFKQIQRVKRQRLDGIIAKKGNDFIAVTADGTYSVLDAAIKYFEAEEGDPVVILLPRDSKQVPFGAIDSIPGKGNTKKKDNSEKRDAPKKDVKKEVKKEEKASTEKRADVKKTKVAKKVVSKDKAKKSASPKKGTALKGKGSKSKKEKVVESAVDKKDVPGEGELR